MLLPIFFSFSNESDSASEAMSCFFLLTVTFVTSSSDDVSCLAFFEAGPNFRFEVASFLDPDIFSGAVFSSPDNSLLSLKSFSFSPLFINSFLASLTSSSSSLLVNLAVTVVLPLAAPLVFLLAGVCLALAGEIASILPLTSSSPASSSSCRSSWPGHREIASSWPDSQDELSFTSLTLTLQETGGLGYKTGGAGDGTGKLLIGEAGL